MAKTKLERISSIEDEIRQLENQKKRLIQEQKQQERKDRTKRLIERGAILESLIDGAATLTNDQIKTLLAKVIATEQSRRILDGLTAQNAAAAPVQSAETEQGERA